MFDPNQYEPDRELTTRQAATIAKKDRRTIVSWIQAGFLSALRNPGKRGHYRILWKDLYELLNQPAIPRR